MCSHLEIVKVGQKIVGIFNQNEIFERGFETWIPT